MWHDTNCCSQAISMPLQEVRPRDARADDADLLAGETVHDLKNLLAGIRMFADLARGRLPAGSPVLEMLANIQHACTEAGDLCRGQAEISAVVLDMAMPGIDGAETLRRLRRIAPGVPAVVVSGSSREELAGRFGEEAPDAFLSKPFLVDDLIAAICGGAERYERFSRCAATVRRRAAGRPARHR